MSANKTRTGSRNDKFVLFLVLLVVLILLGFGLSIFYYKFVAHSYVAPQTYLTLAPQVIENEEQIARVQVSIQVASKDQAWMEQHKTKIDQIFQASIKAADPAQFRSAEGCTDMLQQLKKDLNTEMDSTKIQAVWYADLLMQMKSY